MVKEGGEGRGGKGREGKGVPECPNPELASLYSSREKLLESYLESSTRVTRVTRHSRTSGDKSAQLL